MERRRYLVVIEQAPDGGYGAYAPDVPGCVGLGRSVKGAMQSFRESLELWVEEALNDGLPIPQSVSQPAFVEVEVPSGERPTQARVFVHAGLAPQAGVEPESLTGEELRRQRELLDLSQSELAAALGVHPNTIAKWERGEQPIQHPRMLVLALDELAREHAVPRG